MSKFGTLKKTQTQNYVAPDVLKDNILRGKGDLTKTGGPVKTQRRDELKESLVAKREQWKKEKEEGIVHERKVSGPPQTPQKPGALAKRELLGRSESIKASSPEKPKTATPEALVRHRSLKEKPKGEEPKPVLEKQTSAPVEASIQAATVLPKKQTSETSKMAARFNPGLAGILARGPPAATEGSNAPSRSESPAIPQRSATPAMSPPSEPAAEGAQLQDMRKGRAKGPKRRKGGAKETESEDPEPTASQPKSEPIATKTSADPERQQSRPEETLDSTLADEKPKPRALPGSAASIMMQSLHKAAAPAPAQKDAAPEKPAIAAKSPSISSPNTCNNKPTTPAKSSSLYSPQVPEQKPATPAKSAAILSSTTPSQRQAAATEPAIQQRDVPEFKGFGLVKKPNQATLTFEEDKENAGEVSPSVKSTALGWGSRQSPPKRSGTPGQIQLPSKKDEEAAMRSAGLLASSPSRPGSSNGLGISASNSNGSMETGAASATAPPKPAKPSRSVSGQLREASPNKG